MRLVPSLVPLLVLGFTPVAQPPAMCRPQLLVLPNSYPATEASAWPTEGWLGWRHFERPETLEPVHLAMGERRKGVGEDDEVDVTAIPDADFAVRCIPEVQPGRIFSAGVVNKSLAHEGPLTVAVAATRYRLRLESKRKDSVRRAGARVWRGPHAGDSIPPTALPMTPTSRSPGPATSTATSGLISS